MRITCPNCGAQYEVPEEVIPQDGRDVQCSNCGVTWFQAHPDHPQEEAADPDVETAGGLPATTGERRPVTAEAGDDDPDEAGDDAEDDSDAADDLPDAAFDDGSDDGTDDDDGDRTVIAPPPPPREKSRELDPSVADILREEAQHEARLRSTGDADPLESQTELALDEPHASTVAAKARARAERLRQNAAGAEESQSRRDLLPDIEEINSTLRSDGGKSVVRRPESDAEANARGGSSGNTFSRGFATMIILAVLLVLLYANAPMLSQKVPALDAVINAFVGTVDKARLWLDAQVKGFTG
ncbi:MAG: thioredoxin [Rhodobacteraceae bacterium]|nr:thioredoxin [Paracoccaceae bacterium]